MAWTVEFYVDRRGRSPVAGFLDGVGRKDLARIRNAIRLLTEFGLELGQPHVKHVSGKLWELRVRSSGQAYRILYFVHVGQRFVLLHAFVKKTAKTPQSAVNIAEARMAEYLERTQ
jgi:phage-related protein